MNERQEQLALKIFKTARRKLFSENIDSACIDLNRLISLYPETHIALKSKFLICIAFKMQLYTECILAETFSNGIKAVGTNIIADLFNKDRYYYVNKYESYAAKRLITFNNFRKFLVGLLEEENYAVINMYINLSSERLKTCKPLEKLEEIRTGTIIPELELNKLINDLQFYLLVTILGDDFDIEYTDELSSLTKRKLNRVDFYHSCMTWLNKFYALEQQYQTGDLIRKCCQIILGLTSDSAHPKRREAYQVLSNMYDSYYSMVDCKKELKEITVLDVEEELFTPTVGANIVNKDCLINLVCCDDRFEVDQDTNILPAYQRLALEIDLEPSPEILIAKKELMKSSSDQLNAEENDNSFNLKIEFD